MVFYWTVVLIIPTARMPTMACISNDSRLLSSANAVPTVYKPEITARYPLEDHHDNPLNNMVASFCFSILGDKIVEVTDFQLPKIHHFVLTDEAGRKMYGTCLTIWEECGSDGSSNGKKKKTLSPRNIIKRRSAAAAATSKKEKTYLPRVLCLLSTWPYLTAFREYLAQLWRLATTTDQMSAPVERYVLNICSEVPAPPPGAFELRMDILDSAIRFWAPPANQPIPYVALPFNVLFQCLDLSNVLFVWYSLALERRILLVSSQASLLTVCSEILCSLLFPMQWSHLYIPLLPQSLSQILDAPFPYLCGVCTENISAFMNDIGDETIVVDLDRNVVTTGPCAPHLPPLPVGRREKLEAALETAAGEVFWKARDATKKEVAEAFWGSGELTRRQVDACDHYKLQQFWNTQDVVHGTSEIKRPQQRDRKSVEAIKRMTQHGEAVWKERLYSFDDAFNLACTPDSVAGSRNISDENGEEEQTTWDTVQEAFLLFYVSTLKHYRNFLVEPGVNDAGNSEYNRWDQCAEFRTEDFIEAQREDYQPFLRELCSTQQFDDFIIRKRGLPDVIFFDQTIEDKLNRTKRKFKSKVETPFLMSAKAHKVLKPVRAVEPNRSDLPFDGPVNVDDLEVQRTFVYKSFPDKFDPALFGKPRPLPQMINAEFDRQAALLDRLRAKYTDEAGDDDSLAALKWDTTERSPEVATFGLYFTILAPFVGKAYEDEERRLYQDERNWNIPTKNSGSGRSLSRDSDGLFYPATLPSAKSRRDLRNHIASTRSEFIEMASAQLDLAFDSLSMMKERGIRSSVADRDICKRLMEACGRCNDLTRAKELLGLMNEANIAPDPDTLMCYMKAFSLSKSSLNGIPMSTSRTNSEKTGTSVIKKGKRADEWNLFGERFHKNMEETQASFSESQKRMGQIVKDTFNLSERSSNVTDNSLESGSSTTDVPHKSSIHSPNQSSAISKKGSPKLKLRHNLFSLHHSDEKSLKSKQDIVVTDPIKRQVVLGDSLLSYLYPDLVVDTESDTCPQCSTVLKEDEIILGWKACDVRDHTTMCPKCKHRFVPRFSVTSSSPAFEGSQGRNTPLYCEYLSPWVVRYLLLSTIERSENGVDAILHPEFRRSGSLNATLFWCCVQHFIRFQLPLTLLLQGNFDHCLIAPSPERSGA